MRSFKALLPLVLLVMLLAACGGDKSPTPSDGPGPDSPEPTRQSFQPPSEEPFPVQSPVIPDIDLTPNQLDVDKASHSQTYKKSGAVVMEASADLPAVGVSFIDDYYQGAMEDIKYRCGKLSEDAASRSEKGTLLSPYSYAEDFELCLNAGGLFSVCRTALLSIDGGRAETTVYCETFDTESGEMLSMDDLFTKDRREYTERLMYGVRRYITKNSASLYADAEDAALETFPYDLFCVTENGISLYYPEDSIAPAALGPVRIDIEWEVFGDIRKV